MANFLSEHGMGKKLPWLIALDEYVPWSRLGSVSTSGVCGIELNLYVGDE